MTVYSTEAIVLATKNFGQADKLIRLFTLEKGYVEAVAFGIRRPKNTLAGVLQLFHRVDMSLTEGENLDTIRTCLLKERFANLAEDINKMPYAAFFTEIVAGLSPLHQVAKEIYDFLGEVLPLFNQHNPRLVAVITSFKLLELLGIGLNYTKCVACGKKLTGDDNFFSPLEGGGLCNKCKTENVTLYTAKRRAMLDTFLQLDLQKPPKFSVKGTDLLWAEENLIFYVQENLGKKLQSLEFLRQMH